MIMVIWLSVIQYDYSHIVLWLLPIWPLYVVWCRCLIKFLKFLFCGISRRSEKSANVWPHMSTLHSSSNCTLRSVVTRECWEKAKILTCLADLPTHAPTTFASPWHHQFAPWLQVWQLAICIPKWASGWPGVMSLAPSCTATQTKTLRKPVWDGNLRPCLPEWQFHPAFIFFFYYSSVYAFLFFLPPPVV